MCLSLSSDYSLLQRMVYLLDLSPPVYFYWEWADGSTLTQQSQWPFTYCVGPGAIYYLL